MKRAYFIGGDTHCHHTDLAVVTSGGRLTKQCQLPTTIPALVAALKEVPRPRYLTFEEGPLADWLHRSLLPFVDGITVCDPRRNHLISKDGDHADPIDAVKLAHLLRGGFVKAVHHPESLDRSAFKHLVNLYNDRIRHRVQEANRIMACFRRYGVFLNETSFVEPDQRAESLNRLPNRSSVRSNVRLLLRGYDMACQQVKELQRRLVRQARRIPEIQRFTALPGVQWIRASIFFAYIDTPWRFKSKSALWRYMGIGLQRWQSGNGAERVRVVPSTQACRPLKYAILGAAISAIAARDNPFAEQHRRWLAQGILPRNARRNVARSQAMTLWGMWKNGDVYRPERVGIQASMAR